MTPDDVQARFEQTIRDALGTGDDFDEDNFQDHLLAVVEPGWIAVGGGVEAAEIDVVKLLRIHKTFHLGGPGEAARVDQEFEELRQGLIDAHVPNNPVQARSNTPAVKDVPGGQEVTCIAQGIIYLESE